MRARSFVLASALAVVATLLVPGSAAAAGTVEVSPSTGLVDLQMVTVTANGFGSGFVGMCQAAADRPAEGTEQCGGTVVLIPAEGAPTGYTVRRFIRIAGSGETVDCLDPATPCVIAVANSADIPGTVVDAPLAFAPPPPPPASRGTLSVEPSTDLVGDEPATVTGTGFRPDVDVEVLQCPTGPADPTGCGPDAVVARTDATGGFTADVTIRRLLTVGASDDDCAVAPGCVVAAAEVADLEQTLVAAPLAFRPPPPPTLTIDPDAELLHDDAVTLDGIGFAPLAPVTLCQVVVDHPEPCDIWSSTDALGSFSYDLTVDRYPYAAALGRSVDCADPATPCALRTETSAGQSSDVVLRFLPSPAPPVARGTVTVEPDAAVADTGAVVTGAGFRSGAEVRVEQCTASVADPSDCDLGISGISVVADEEGAFTATLPLSNTISVPGFRTADCAVAGACAVAAYERVDPAGTLATAPVTVLPVPTVTVTPDAGLRTGDVVEVRSTTWPAGETVDVQQCGYADGSQLVCGAAQPVVVGADGSVSATLTVRRVIGDLDCTDDPCAAVVTATPGAGGVYDQFFLAGPDRADAQIVRLINGSLIGDGAYDASGAGQSQTRPVAPGGHWSFALRIENDGDEVQDITVAGLPGTEDVAVDYFYGWFDVTTLVTAEGGMRLHQVQPGEARTIVARFRVAPDAEPGTLHQSLVTATSTLDADVVDAVLPGIRVATP